MFTFMSGYSRQLMDMISVLARSKLYKVFHKIQVHGKIGDGHVTGTTNSFLASTIFLIHMKTHTERSVQHITFLFKLFYNTNHHLLVKWFTSIHKVCNIKTFIYTHKFCTTMHNTFTFNCLSIWLDKVKLFLDKHTFVIRFTSVAKRV